MLIIVGDHRDDTIPAENSAPRRVRAGTDFRDGGWAQRASARRHNTQTDPIRRCAT